MKASELVSELGAALGITLSLGEEGTCRVFFDEDAVDFEKSGESLYVMADLSSASGREDACKRLLSANCLGSETGSATLSLDAAREVFMLHTMFQEDTPYPAFEERISMFVKALRYWKEWLSLPPSNADSSREEEESVSTLNMIRI
ncbi:MAG: type III secretion system chaperone [Mailhella sp.]